MDGFPKSGMLASQEVLRLTYVIAYSNVKK